VTTDYSIELLRDFINVVGNDPDPSTLVSNIALRTLAHLDCRGVILGVIRHEGFLDLIGTYGYPDELTDPYKKIPLWTPLPITDATRTGKPIVLTSVDAMIEKYPHYPDPQVGEKIAISSFPIISGSSVIGAIGFTSVIAPSPNFMSSPATESFLALCGIYLQNWKSKLNNPESLDFDLTKQALTTRQKKIIKYFSEHLTTDQIAERLNFSPSTIKQDIIKIYELLGVHSRDHVLEIMKKVDLVG
jgi:DNA-binding CsgD family transcriptional regulator